MAGTITISTLSDGTNSTSATNPILGSAKAWINFDGTVATPSTIRASYNISSVTRNSTGNYTLNFTTAFTDANYSVAGGVCTNIGGGCVLARDSGGLYTTTQFQFFTAQNDNSTANNPSVVNIQVFGN